MEAYTSSGYTWNISNSKKVLFVEGDIADDIDLRRVFNEKPNIIFHLAAFFANQNSVDYPQLDLQTNGSGTLKLLEYSLLNTLNTSSSSFLFPNKVIFMGDFELCCHTSGAQTRLLWVLGRGEKDFYALGEHH